MFALCDQLAGMVPDGERYLRGRLHFLAAILQTLDIDESLEHWDLPLGLGPDGLRQTWRASTPQSWLHRVTGNSQPKVISRVPDRSPRWQRMHQDSSHTAVRQGREDGDFARFADENGLNGSECRAPDDQFLQIDDWAVAFSVEGVNHAGAVAGCADHLLRRVDSERGRAGVSTNRAKIAQFPVPPGKGVIGAISAQIRLADDFAGVADPEGQG